MSSNEAGARQWRRKSRLELLAFLGMVLITIVAVAAAVSAVAY